jgi:hypothetical protein
MTDFAGTQLTTILSALDGRTRNPASKAAAFAAIRRHADAFGRSLEGILDTAAGLLDGQISADALRATLRDKAAAQSVESPEEGAGQNTPTGPTETHQRPRKRRRKLTATTVNPRLSATRQDARSCR